MPFVTIGYDHDEKLRAQDHIGADATAPAATTTLTSDFTRGLGMGVGVVVGLVTLGWIVTRMADRREPVRDREDV